MLIQELRESLMNEGTILSNEQMGFVKGGSYKKGKKSKKGSKKGSRGSGRSGSGRGRGHGHRRCGCGW